MLKILNDEQPQTRAVTLTPEIAAALLEANAENQRRARPRKVREYAAAMRRGEWRLTHQGVAMATDGTMIDGQHRCLAVIEAGVSVPMMVTTGVDPATFAVVDRGMARTHADAIGLDRRVSDIVSWGTNLIHGRGASTVLVLGLANTSYGRVASDLIEHCGTRAKLFSSAGVGAAAVCAALNGHKEHAFDAYRALVTRNYDCQSTAAQELSRAAARVGGKARLLPNHTEGRTWVAKFYRAFDPATADFGTRISPATVEKTIDKMRSAIVACYSEQG